MRNELKISANGSAADYVDDSGVFLDIHLFTNGRCNLTVTAKHKSQSVSLSNKAAHQLRDMLNRRYPNATAVQ